MTLERSGLELVQRFWALYQARRWREAQALLKPDAHCNWWSTAERFDGAAAIVHVNEIYPEGWRIHLLELNALAPSGVGSAHERVHSLVRVDHGDGSFYANSFFAVAAGQVLAIDEYWADTQSPPTWRASGDLPGQTLVAPDRRPGLSLQLDDALETA